MYGEGSSGSSELPGARVRLGFASGVSATVWYLLAFPLRWVWWDGLFVASDRAWQKMVQAKLFQPLLLWLHAVLRRGAPQQAAIAAAAARHAADLTFGWAMLFVVGAYIFSLVLFYNAVVAFRSASNPM